MGNSDTDKRTYTAEDLEREAREFEMTAADGRADNPQIREAYNDRIASMLRYAADLALENEQLREDMNTKYWDTIRDENTRLRAELDEAREYCKQMHNEMNDMAADHRAELASAKADARDIAAVCGCLEPDEDGMPACAPPCISCRQFDAARAATDESEGK